MRNIKLQKRSIFNRIFGNKPDNNLQNNNQQLTAVQMLNGYNNRICTYSGDLYDNATIRSVVDTIARYFAKMQMVHRLKGTTVNDSLNTLLTLRPNPDMSPYTFLYKIATCYEMDNNAYIYVERDDLGNVTALWPFSYSQAELKENKYGDLYLEFTFSTGKKVVASTDDVIILRRNIYKNDFFSETNNKPLYPVVNLLHTISQGIINAVKSSAIIRGIYKVIGSLQPNDIKEKRDNFKDQFFDTQNNGGIIVMDSKGDYTPIDSKPVLVDDKNSKLVNEQVYTYFGVNENIVKGTYTEDEFTAFYEGILEPLALQISEEMNAKLFSQREIGFGNEVVFVGDKLSYMSMTSKVNMINAVKDLGVLTKGTIADILNIERPADPDTILQSLNYIDTSIANQYQLQTQQDKLAGLTQPTEGGDSQNEE